MKKHKNIENTPLLYIVQPKLNTVTTNMQQAIFITSQKERKKDKEEKVEQILEVDNASRKKRKLKQFQEMNVEEQVTFLLNIPSKLQSIRCVIATKETKYYGTIVDYQNEVVSIEQPDLQLLKLKMKDIEKITIVDVKD